MAIKPFTVERPTFVGGVLLPAGSTVELDNIHGGKGDVPAGKMDLRDNLSSGEADAVPEYEVADVAPRAPGTTTPQALPPETTQRGNTLVHDGAQVVGDKHETKPAKK